jgi:malonyl CoA-acyl carrier protein transacylase
MEYLAGQSVTSIMEVGPGKVLTGLARRDMRPDQSLNLDKLTDVEELAAVLA